MLYILAPSLLSNTAAAQQQILVNDTLTFYRLQFITVLLIQKQTVIATLWGKLLTVLALSLEACKPQAQKELCFKTVSY